MKLKNNNLPYQYIELKNKRSITKKRIKKNFIYNKEFDFNNNIKNLPKLNSNEIYYNKWSNKRLKTLKVQKEIKESDINFLINLNNLRQQQNLKLVKNNKSNNNIKLTPKKLLLKNISKKYFKCYPKGNLDLIIKIINKETKNK